MPSSIATVSRTPRRRWLIRDRPKSRSSPSPWTPDSSRWVPSTGHSRRRFEPLLDHADDAPVADPMLDESDQPGLTNRIKERADVGVQYEVHLPGFDRDHERIHGVVSTAAGPEPVREPEEIFLVDRVQHRGHCPLDDLVLQCCDRERALSAVCLGYVHPP